MKRREVVVGLGGAAVGWPLLGPLISSAAAQVHKPRLAMLLVAASETSPEFGQRRDALAELGWVDGRTIEIVARFADGDFDLVPGLITERWLSNPTCSHAHRSGSAGCCGAYANHPHSDRRGRRGAAARACRRSRSSCRECNRADARLSRAARQGGRASEAGQSQCYPDRDSR